jgi:hypothetical protein
VTREASAVIESGASCPIHPPFVVDLAIALVCWRLGGRRPGTVALALATVLIVGVGISRIYLGAHWLSDVLGGYLAGALWLLLLVAVGPSSHGSV